MRERLAVGAGLLAALLMPAIAPFVPREPAVDYSILQRPFKLWAGHAYITHFGVIQRSKGDDPKTGHISTLQLFEDGKPLGPAHISFADVATLGGGRYMDLDQDFMMRTLAFSASDNSDPNTNGRTYRVVDPKAVNPDATSARVTACRSRERPK